MSGYGKRRDACEKDIVRALEAAGATVTKLDGKGVPDLLVGFRGRTFLIEVKDPETGDRNSQVRKKGVKRSDNELGLRESQWAWWRSWRGERPFVATTPDAALRVVGAIGAAAPAAPGDGVFAADRCIFTGGDNAATE